jgi:predicted enzyme related to lactoylglutathione lyase
MFGSAVGPDFPRAREVSMFSKINHVAIVSENYALLAKFYEAVFGMKHSNYERAARAVTVGDGYVGLNINPRRAGRSAGLDHFGIQVEDCETAFERMRKRYPTAKWLKRPSNRPFAGISANDPDGNVFDISQKDMSNRTAIYVENDGKPNPRHIHHVAMRTMNPDDMAEFYSAVFELAPGNKQAGDRNHYLTDGHVTLVIMPWQIADYDGTGIVTAGMDHIGFNVENVEAVKADVAEIAANNPRLAPSPLGTGKEGAALAKLFQRSCPLGQHRFADPDGVLLDIMAD